MLFMMLPTLSVGGDHKYIAYVTGPDILSGDTIRIQDPQYSLYLNDSSYYKSIFSRVFIEVNETDGIHLDSSWQFTASLVVSYTDTSGQLHSNLPISLKINYNDSSLKSYTRKDVFEMAGAHKVAVHIDAISDTTLLLRQILA